jgi:hypothetical protein
LSRRATVYNADWTASIRVTVVATRTRRTARFRSSFEARIGSWNQVEREAAVEGRRMTKPEGTRVLFVRAGRSPSSMRWKPLTSTRATSAGPDDGGHGWDGQSLSVPGTCAEPRSATNIRGCSRGSRRMTAPLSSEHCSISTRSSTRSAHTSSRFAPCSRTTMKKKRKRIELSAEWRERHERTQRMLLERLEFHRRRLAAEKRDA